VFVNDVYFAGPPPAAPQGTGGAAAPAGGPPANSPLGKPGPYHKGEIGDYQLDPNAPPMVRGATGRAPAGMKSPSCSAATPQPPHAHIQGGEVPGHFYRVEFPTAN
jgi:hypothetical protein